MRRKPRGSVSSAYSVLSSTREEDSDEEASLNDVAVDIDGEDETDRGRGQYRYSAGQPTLPTPPHRAQSNHGDSEATPLLGVAVPGIATDQDGDLKSVV